MDGAAMWPLLLVGLLTGVFSWIFVIGGGIILVPILIMGLGFAPIQASGISLMAMLAPVGVFGVIHYYKAGVIQATHFKYGALIAIGILCGTYFGARIATSINSILLQRLFALVMVGAAVKLWLSTLK